MDSDGILEQFLVAEGLQVFRCHRRRIKFRKRLCDRIERSPNANNTASAIALALVNLVKNQTVSRKLDKQLQMEILTLAAHIGEKYKVGETGLLHMIAQLYFHLVENFWDWFQFLSPFEEAKRKKESSLYPFHPMTIGGGIEWVTPRHLKALDYFLNCTWRMIIFARMNRNFSYAGEYHQPSIVNESYVPVNLVNCPMNDKLFGTVTPMTLACLSGHPEAVLLLLRHGAASLHPYNQILCPQHDWSQPLYALVNQLNAFPPSKNKPKPDQDNGVNRGQNLLRCLVYVSRTMNSVPLKIVPKTGVNHVCQPQVLGLLAEFKDFLPEHCTGGVARLQHLCRCMIRHSIQMHHHLPSHIYDLPLPSTIKNYLDLQTDL